MRPGEMTVTEAANLLRETAKALDRLNAQLLLPVDETVTLHDACQRLQAAMAPDSCHIDMSIMMFAPGEAPSVKYSIWDGGRKEIHQGRTLAEALNLALLARTPPPANPLAQAEALVEAQLCKQELDERPF